MIRPLAAFSLLAAAPLALTACGTSDAPAEGSQEAREVTIENARLVLPSVSGNPGAVYLDITNGSEKAVEIVSGELDGAGKTEFHLSQMADGAMMMGEAEPQTIQPGGSLAFKPGSFHLMAFDLGPDFAPGGEAEGALVTADGKRHPFTATIQSAGDAR